MTNPRIHSPRKHAAANLDELLLALESELGVPAPFDEQTLKAAQEAVDNLRAPEHDDTALPFFTIDPEGATDLDQAMYLERKDDGYLVHYAIADVPTFVALNSKLDEVTRERGQTYYLPQRKINLHPPLISEDAGSLLPGAVRPVFLWLITLDSAGAITDVQLRRTTIKSREMLDYASAQAKLDSGHGGEQLELLAQIGAVRIEQERLRGGASLNLPDQEVEPDNGGYKLVSRQPLPLEDYNAQISLLTGMAAARIMLDHGTGILRTMPAPDEKDLAEFKEQTKLLGHPWDGQLNYGQYLRTLDVNDPRQLVIMHRAASLFRGADYDVINGQNEDEMEQAALAAPYAHTTAPLRRLVDRFVLLCCFLQANAKPIPDELREALEQLPGLMRESSISANQISRAAINLIEAYVLQHRVGERFEAIVLREATGAHNGDPASTEAKDRPGNLQLVTEPITGQFTGSAAPGTLVTVTLRSADPATRKIMFDIVG
ncbi:ribonuclease II [Arthrobacter sp. MYb211]|uniref:RNB domain-containing ribonuclease n=1 Tax=unclassified Arthrobacter TaxID=235627 RepID=UPI000CFDD01F|nr:MULTISPECIES: RNB domain-containing ribonuclease [unclassified Arthrobacter]PQZ99256.1 ribonuclease II [Arthrobacter sp. MYb224]PRA12802.1 ribonuclease II [Arthrobacter sp. MYb221]PRC09678.1 ribonuclease II [Arthrobacter sp. MYb211]